MQTNDFKRGFEEGRNVGRKEIFDVALEWLRENISEYVTMTYNNKLVVLKDTLIKDLSEELLKICQEK